MSQTTEPLHALRLTVHPCDRTGPPGVFTLLGQPAVLGRDPSADIVVDAPSISARHTAFAPSPLGYTVEDLRSRNGSAHSQGGGEVPQPLTPGHPVLLTDGDLLLLGDAQDPLRIEVAALPGVFAAAPPPTRTIVARQPLADLTIPTGDRPLTTLAAQALDAATAEQLAEHARAFLAALAPDASAHAVTLWGPGLAGKAGAALPGGLRDAALAGTEAILFEEAGPTGAALPTTASIAQAQVAAALVAPLSMGGATYGVLAAWSTTSSALLPAAAVPDLSIAASLLAMAGAHLSARLASARERERLSAENARLRGAPIVPAIVGESPAFVRATTLARTVAPSDVTVLITGETGSGKEVLARQLHGWSRRAHKPFVAFNCAAVPDSLIESELFGHVRGAFTGAGRDRQGMFEEADGGTLFLDEIGEMPTVMQAKLLRVLQDGEVRPVGASRTRHVDVRVLSATHRDLASLAEAGRFRADLMYRLNAVTIALPPLRERGQDTALLAHFLLDQAMRAARKTVAGFSSGALLALSRYPFPGNVRELQNEVLRAVALTPQGRAIEAAVLSDRVAQLGPSPDEAAEQEGTTLKDIVARTERHAIRRALERHDGNVAATARELGLTRPGLYKVMDRLGLR